ncbi:MAG: energy transducer TonB [Gemmatimonadetes bacterium]|uniref:Energy transducer TonB n=1 Tax=Candidatus Kutchimonas denitrificans TaxID=3056748 RepID=A0AAE4ZA63_9BACT|nr:energy transducer TonB [Gemmatimonadota bacterium]NIR75507.1 energy transducer TonB [Candidatus Kutchimonas denitrificans]NIS01821.1 energy transducer TonB [Gemmatimonadota bacterium]NIT67602.1 energy transducer TonB [Gemmatimonadota bacterium]NIU53476.1 TonB family protein [Gemmatimonadota bacterium]
MTAGLIVATAAVAYAAASDLIDVDALFRKPVQRLPALRSQEMPFRYPVRLWREGVEGEVLLRIHISVDGTVDSVELSRSSGHAALDSIAMAGAERLRYHPATVGTQPVAVWAALPVRFQRTSMTSSPEER